MNSGARSHLKRNLVKELARLKKYKEHITTFAKPTKIDMANLSDQIRSVQEQIAKYEKAKI